MQRRITTTMIALGLPLGLALWNAGRGVKAKATLAASPGMTSSPLARFFPAPIFLPRA